MNQKDIHHNAVNWEFGMLVAPEHFLRQERFYEAEMLWMMRYTHDGFGLIGGGPRLPESEVGAVRHDPVITLLEDEHTLRITVTQCRGLTVSGTPVEITPDYPLYQEFSKSDLEGIKEARIYIVAPPHVYTVLDGAPDEHNPQMQTERIRCCRLTLQPHGEEVQHAIAVSRIRRSERSLAYEQDSRFIPPCTHLTAFSELSAAWRRIVEQLSYLSSRFIELHRAMQEYIELTRERGIDVGIDRDTLEFVKRIIPSIEACLYDCLNPTQLPAQFFGSLRKFLQGAAVSLDLNPPVQQYFDALKNAGETEFVPLVEQQKQLLKSSPRWRVEDDLGLEVRFVQNSLRSLQTLERALEGKYIDFRVSPTLDTMNFVFDRGGSALYKLAAKPARLQGFGDEMTFYFANVRLEGREKYRIILTAELDHEYAAETQLPVEIRINEGSGSRRAPIHGVGQVRFAGQKNVEFDFEAPDIATVTDLRVAVPAHFSVRTALLFVRHRFYAQDTEKMNLPSQSIETSPRANEEAEGLAVVRADAAPRAFRPPLQPQPARNWNAWGSREEQTAASETGQMENPVPPPRRRRLE
ncbi:type VI secretion system baseplate subunit TssK [Edaphobacter modestus]|uniref:Putative component of type VI protein secretion system n=1 Tax=Edaphobacter modestus TaxID=388466 RepID=A0A4Q7YRH5_9BACT|nr:type VI secretion system baseplate subunit TssK [Edaphobacter modestus]RZU40307.1 putative component of type VI protein secretion system [Edaphobacter modestus]